MGGVEDGHSARVRNRNYGVRYIYGFLRYVSQ